MLDHSDERVVAAILNSADDFIREAREATALFHALHETIAKTLLQIKPRQNSVNHAVLVDNRIERIDVLVSNSLLDGLHECLCIGWRGRDKLSDLI